MLGQRTIPGEYGDPRLRRFFKLAIEIKAV
jgi:hypothetical protein